MADDVIEFIKRRTEDGVDRRGRDFPPYSAGYIRSLDFKIAGKSPGKVDLTLSGDMLAAIELLDHDDGEIVIGYVDGTPENDRAEGNMLGSYGGEPNPRKARRFLGISRGDLADILDHYTQEGADE